MPIYNPATKWEKQPTLSSLNSMYLGSGWYASKFHLTTVSEFNPGSIPFIGIETPKSKDEFSSKLKTPLPLRWIGVENQFFTVLLTPAEELPIDHGQFFMPEPDAIDRGYVHTRPEDPDIEAAATFPAITVPANKAVTLNYGIYAGPKDFNGLDALGANQGELMNYGVVLDPDRADADRAPFLAPYFPQLRRRDHPAHADHQGDHMAAAKHRQPFRQTDAGARAEAQGTAGQVQGNARKAPDGDVRAL